MPISDKQFHDAVGRLDSKIDTVNDRLNDRVREFTRELGELAGTKRDNQIPGVLLYLLGTAIILYCGWLGVEVFNQGKQLAILLAPQKLQAAASDPTNPKSISEVTKLLQDAQKRNQLIEPTLIASVGAKFLAVSQDTPVSWKAAISLLDYRSFLNQDFVPDVGQLTPWKTTSTYTAAVHVIPSAFTNQKPPPEVYSTTISIWVAGGETPDNKSARLEDLAKPQSGSPDVAYFVVDGSRTAAIGLDGAYMRNVIVRNTAVVYNGGPLRLENVYFVNCTFQLGSTSRTKAFGSTLLASAGVSFDGTTS